MAKLKKITFYWNRDRYEAYSYVVNVNENISDMEIAIEIEKKRKPAFNIEDYFWSSNSFENSGITTDFEVSDSAIIDLTNI